MIVPFKFLPHEILNKPKPDSAIHIYPLWPHEFFIPKPIEKPATPSKPVTTIRARLLSQNQQTTKKGEKKKRRPMQAHQPPKPTNQHSITADPSATCHQNPSSPSTTATEDVEPLPKPRPETGSHHSSMLRAAAVFPTFALPPIVDP